MEERIRELSAYLTASGLNNYKLTNQEKALLTNLANGAITFQLLKSQIYLWSKTPIAS